MAFGLPLPSFWLLAILSWAIRSAAASSAAVSSIRTEVVTIVAIFNSEDLETMTRVLNKTLAALNKENGRNPWRNQVSSWNDYLPLGWMFEPGDHRRVRAKKSSRLQVDSVVYSAQWWMNQSSHDLCNLLSVHKTVAILVLADESSVLRAALISSIINIPVIGSRSSRTFDTSSFQVFEHYY